MSGDGEEMSGEEGEISGKEGEMKIPCSICGHHNHPEEVIECTQCTKHKTWLHELYACQAAIVLLPMTMILCVQKLMLIY